MTRFRWRVEGRSFTEVAPGTVLVEGHDQAVGSESGIEVENPWFGIFVFRGDEIAALHIHHLRREALAAAGFTEAAADTGEPSGRMISTNQFGLAC